MKKIVLLFFVYAFLTSISYSQEKNVTVSGSVVLSNVSDYSGVTVTFNRTAPSNLQYNLETESSGEFQLEIKEGMYNIIFNKEYYKDTVLYDVNLFDNKDLGTIPITYLGIFLKGELSGVLKSGVYEVRDTIFVPKSKSLTIEKGTTLKFHKDAYFLVEGDFTAEGTENERILFTSFKTDEYWRGIKFIKYNEKDNTFASIKYLTFENAGGGKEICALDLQLIDFNIDNFIYQNNKSNIILFGTPKWSYIRNSSIVNNTDTIDAAIVIGSEIIMENCLIANNIVNKIVDNPYLYNSDSEAGGIRVITINTFYPIIKNTIIINNKSNFNGGILTGLGTKIINCVILNNKAKWNGSAIGYSSCDSNAEVINTIIANNQCENFDDAKKYGYQISGGGSRKLSIKNNLIYSPGERNWSSPPTYFGKYVRTNFNGDSTDAYGNIFRIPNFDDEANGNFRLMPGSPAIDAGFNSDSLPEKDFDGNVRLWDGNNDNFAIVDIGAFEYDAPEFFMIKSILSNDYESGSDDFTSPDENTYKKTNEDAHSGTYSLMLDNSNGGNGNSWLLSKKFKTLSKKKYYLSLWLKLSGAEFGNEDKMQLHFCSDNGDISNGNYKIKEIQNFEKLWQKIMIEVEGDGSEYAQFAVSTTINSNLKLYVDDIKVESDQPTSVDEPIKPGDIIQVYPNPSNGVITIAVIKELIHSPFNFEIFNVDGRMIQNTVSRDIVTRIEGFNSGTYYLRFNNKDYTIIKKFVVVK
ncbi:MAG: hypothetical protein A2X61_11755 [Ignavibacteria bacterium GWB2_35_12]|nr:MAG: hypothetical protein A2X63_09030 [Ignavibacteria bacterium GWA2_35_8]OGU41938.1 MAG: hypothetical protein A2X61_11755 [Ignavibacteria bacterium GWB2_35_12]OGU96096.1 MAG: hypothetical protein A2220_14945 [Ignavibacteria bacterium RIFOXYA2_FULL_35_10]OGV24469.1 MAG: hypothetical protein A2475_12850 [Ignavibacteria bacterium RIFOXYC2_FULL_35_21]